MREHTQAAHAAGSRSQRHYKNGPGTLRMSLVCTPVTGEDGLAATRLDAAIAVAVTAATN